MMRIDLLGTSFQIKSDESPEYIGRLLDHYRARIDQIERTVATGDPLKKAILAALLVTDELFSQRDGQGSDSLDLGSHAQEIEEITTRLLSQLDETLPKPSKD
jgi:cell division protein ZapA (FtsZ GTPase activity inhibitor)